MVGYVWFCLVVAEAGGRGVRRGCRGRGRRVLVRRVVLGTAGVACLLGCFLACFVGCLVGCLAASAAFALAAAALATRLPRGRAFVIPDGVDVGD